MTAAGADADACNPQHARGAGQPDLRRPDFSFTIAVLSR